MGGEGKRAGAESGWGGGSRHGALDLVPWQEGDAGCEWLIVWHLWVDLMLLLMLSSLVGRLAAGSVVVVPSSCCWSPRSSGTVMTSLARPFLSPPWPWRAAAYSSQHHD